VKTKQNTFLLILTFHFNPGSSLFGVLNFGAFFLTHAINFQHLHSYTCVSVLAKITSRITLCPQSKMWPCEVLFTFTFMHLLDAFIQHKQFVTEPTLFIVCNLLGLCTKNSM